MEIVAYPSEPLADKIESILRRRIGVSDKVDEAVRQVLHQVRERGDQAVVEYTERFDGVSVGDGGYRMSPAALQAGLDGLDASLRAASACSSLMRRAMTASSRLAFSVFVNCSRD